MQGSSKLYCAIPKFQGQEIGSGGSPIGSLKRSKLCRHTNFAIRNALEHDGDLVGLQKRRRRSTMFQLGALP
jgi:hypothetical protein